LKRGKKPFSEAEKLLGRDTCRVLEAVERGVDWNALSEEMDIGAARLATTLGQLESHRLIVRDIGGYSAANPWLISAMIDRLKLERAILDYLDLLRAASGPVVPVPWGLIILEIGRGRARELEGAVLAEVRSQLDSEILGSAEMLIRATFTSGGSAIRRLRSYVSLPFGDALAALQRGHWEIIDVRSLGGETHVLFFRDKLPERHFEENRFATRTR